jgi:hypothetical protein
MCDDLAGVLAAVDEGTPAKSSRETDDDSHDKDDSELTAEEQGGHEYFDRVAGRRSRRLSLIRMTMNAEMSKLAQGNGLLFVF